VENKKEAWDRNSSMQVGGKVLFLLCGMLWLYRHDLNPVNSIIAVVLFFRLAAYGVAKTSLYSKKELERSSPSLPRRAKIYSTLIALSIVFLLLSTATYVFFSEQVGGNPGSYDSEHFYDGAFHNLKQPDDSGGSFFGTMAGYMIDDGSRTPSSVLPTIEFEPIELNDDDVSITWFGHSSLLIQSPNTSVLIDPVFGEDNTDPLFLGPKPFDYEHTYELEDLPKIDVVLISHDHYDHLDMDAVKHLSTSQFLVPLGVEAHLIEWGIPSTSIQEFDWYQEENITDDLNVVFTPSQHFSGRGINPDNTLWGSWAIFLNGHALFFSGDGGYSDEFVEIGQRYGPFEIAFIEAGQYDEAWADVHMFPDQTVQAAIDLNTATLLPIHNTKFVLALHGWDEPLEDVTAEGEKRNQSVTTPMIGQTFLLGEEMPEHMWWRNVSVYEPPFLKRSPIVGMAMYASMILAVVMVRNTSTTAKARVEVTYED
jgi:L-ascorbate metabolism protein UlaG (beta-lactamase superfamily)